MSRITNKTVIEKIEQIEDKLPKGELQEIHRNVSEIKKKLEIYTKF